MNHDVAISPPPDNPRESVPREFSRARAACVTRDPRSRFFKLSQSCAPCLCRARIIDPVRSISHRAHSEGRGPSHSLPPAHNADESPTCIEQRLATASGFPALRETAPRCRDRAFRGRVPALHCGFAVTHAAIVSAAMPPKTRIGDAIAAKRFAPALHPILARPRTILQRCRAIVTNTRPPSVARSNDSTLPPARSIRIGAALYHPLNCAHVVGTDCASEGRRPPFVLTCPRATFRDIARDTMSSRRALAVGGSQALSGRRLHSAVSAAPRALPSSTVPVIAVLACEQSRR